MQRQQKTIRISTRQRSEMIDITREVERFIAQRQVIEGLVVVYVPHTTAGVTINENADPDVRHDMLRKLDELIPKDERYYKHAEGNSDSHVKASLMGSSVTVILNDGKLLLGQWQGIYLCEFDGPRERQVIVRVLETGPKGDR